MSHPGNEDVVLLSWSWRFSIWIVNMIPPAQSVPFAAPPNDEPVIFKVMPTQQITVNLTPG